MWGYLLLPININDKKNTKKKRHYGTERNKADEDTGFQRDYS